MRPLFFIGYTSAIIWSAMRWDWVLYTAIGLFVLIGTLMIFLSIYRHFRVGGWF